MLKLNNVKKSFGSKDVIVGLSFSIPDNSIFGFVGKNGAGKTTTMKMILGLMKADSGEILVGGEKVVYGNTPTNRMIGYLPDVPEFYPYMTPREYLIFCGQVAGINGKELNGRVDELLERVGLSNEKKRIKGFSRGMKQRLGIAQALIGRPRLLICDEPTSALDPLGRKELLDILLASKEETTIMFSTHILSDVEKICDHIAFLNEGKLALSGTISDIKKMQSSNMYQVVVQDKNDIRIIQNMPDIAGSELVDDYTLRIKGDAESGLSDIMRFVLQNNIAIEKIERCENTLENLFMEVVSK